MKILFVTGHSYLPQRVGGSESSTHDLCTAAIARGAFPAVLASLEPKGWLYFSNRLKSKLSIPKVHAPRDLTLGYPTFRTWNIEASIAEVVKRFSPNIAIVQAGGGPAAIARHLVNIKVPTVRYVRDVEFHLHGGQVMESPYLLYISNSEYVARKLRYEFGIPSVVIPPLVEPDRYRVYDSGSRSKVVFVNPHPLKGADIAFSLAESRPDIPFEFVESWSLPSDLYSEYRKRAERLANVVWVGKQIDMRPVYARAKILLVPSMWEEAWGRVVTEAHINGIPVLASNRGGLPESVGPGGIIVPAEAPIEQWESALSRMFDDQERYSALSKAAIAYSKRPDIDPCVLVNRFLDAIRDHAERCGRL